MVINIPKKQVGLDLTLLSLVGKDVKILDSNNKNQIGIEGLIVKETHNFIFLKMDSGKIKSFFKRDLILELSFEGNLFYLNCNQILGSIQQRIKKFKF